jgi:hypothetical protein
MRTKSLGERDIFDKLSQPLAKVALAKHKGKEQPNHVEGSHRLHLPSERRQLRRTHDIPCNSDHARRKDD